MHVCSPCYSSDPMFALSHACLPYRVTRNPILLFLYLFQYFPVFAANAYGEIAAARVANYRKGDLYVT